MVLNIFPMFFNCKRNDRVHGWAVPRPTWIIIPYVIIHVTTCIFWGYHSFQKVPVFHTLNQLISYTILIYLILHKKSKITKGIIYQIQDVFASGQ